MPGERVEVDIVDELAAMIRRVAKGASMDATDGDVLIRAQMQILRMREIREVEIRKATS